jgi:DNA-binding Lrp family transcriptional regulator
MFDACGDVRNDFEILHSKRVSFSSEIEAEADEEIYINEAFKTYDVSYTEDQIIELIKKDSKITPEIISQAIGQSKAYVENKIATLIKRGYLETTTSIIGSDEIIERTVPKALDISIPPPTDKAPPVQIFIKYSYEGPQDSRNRPFCAKLMQLDRLYSRADIEMISQRLGYSVFDRRGGFWNKGGVILDHCRHNWKSNIVVKKK